MADTRSSRSGRSGGRGRPGSRKKKQVDTGGIGFSSLLTPAEWLINTVSRPAYMVGSAVAGDPAGIAKNALALTTLGLSEKIPGLDAPETAVSQALTQRGVDFGGGFTGFALRFGTDFLTDPMSYGTLGTSSVVRAAAREAVEAAGQKALKEAVDLGLKGTAKRAYITAAARGAEKEAKLAKPRQVAVGFSPPGATLVRRGKPIASKDIVLDDSAVGRMLNKAIDGIQASGTGNATARIFATAGEFGMDNRVVNEIVQAVRQQTDFVKKTKVDRILRREEAAFKKAVKENKLDPEAARRSIGAYARAVQDAPINGRTPAAQYAVYVENMAKQEKVKNAYMAFDDVDRILGRRLRVTRAVLDTVGKREVDAGVKAQSDLLENYVPGISRRSFTGAGERKAQKIEGWDTPTNALRSSTTQQSRVLKTSDDWFANGLVPEDDYLRLLQWRMNQSADLIGQQTALNAVASKYGKVLDEDAIVGRFQDRAKSAAAKAVAAKGTVARAVAAADRTDSEMGVRGAMLSDAAAAVGDAKGAGARAVAERSRQLGAEEALQRVFPIDQSAAVAASTRGLAEADRVAGVESQLRRIFPGEAGNIVSTVPRNAATEAAGWTFGEVVSAGSAEALARLARRELALRTDEVQRGLANASEVTPYARFVERAEAAAKNARTAPRQRIRADLQQLRNEARTIINNEKVARQTALRKAKTELRAAKRDGNKAAIKLASANVREARVRVELANAKASRQKKTLEKALRSQRRAEEKSAKAEAKLDAAEAVAERTKKTPGQRVNPYLRKGEKATPQDMAYYKQAGWQQLQYDYDSVVAVVEPSVRKAVDNAFEKAWDITTNQSAFAGVRQFVQSGTSRWKGLALLSVGFHLRNLQSDLMMSWIAGARDPRSLVTAVQVLRNRSGSVVIQGKRMTYSDIAREAAGNGTIHSGQIAQDIGKTVGQSVNKKAGILDKPRIPGEGPVSQGSYAVGRFREDSTRLMLYIEMRKAGNTPEEAAQIVRDYLFDYGDVSRFVKSTRTFLLPFITWSAKALPRMVITAVEKPRVFTRIGFLTDAANESFGPVDKNALPLGRTLSFALPTFGLGSGTYTFNPESVLPYGVLNSFSPFGFQQAGRSVGQFLNPAIKVPIEVATNYNLYQGRTAPRRVRAPIWIRALAGAGAEGGPLDIGPKKDLYTKQEVTGYSRTWDTILRGFPPYQLAQNYPGVGVESDRIGYLRSLLGVNVSPYERQRDLFYAQKYAPKS